MNFLKKIKQNNYLYIGSVCLNIILVFFLVYHLFYAGEIYKSIKFSREVNTNYKFINPILDCEDNNTDSSHIIMYSKINNFTDELLKKYNLKSASIYYRDLNNGPWYGYNEKTYFSPASLVKLPVMIALLRYSEDNNSILNKMVKISQSDIDAALPQNIKSDNILEAGKEYSMKELMNYMIKDSDNVAFNVIKNNFPSQKYINDTFKQIGVDTQNDGAELIIRTKDYAGFFRVLYNASYLSKSNSELALNILSETNFKDGLVALLPNNVVVSHKFGERSFDGNGLSSDSNIEDGTKQLHDCGIVYSKDDPYILCVMTRGSDFKDQESFIKDISHYIYGSVVGR